MARRSCAARSGRPVSRSRRRGRSRRPTRSRTTKAARGCTEMASLISTSTTSACIRTSKPHRQFARENTKAKKDFHETVCHSSVHSRCVSVAALSADWPMWGGTPSRNMVSPLKGMPTTWDVKSGKNVKWVADLGSQSYGNPTVAEGVVLIGTNNEATRDAEAGRRSRRADGLPRGDGRVPVAGDVRQAVVGARERLAVSKASRRHRSSRTASPTSSATAARSLPPTSTASTTRPTTARKDEKLTGTERSRLHLDLRHD